MNLTNDGHYIPNVPSLVRHSLFDIFRLCKTGRFWIFEENGVQQ